MELRKKGSRNSSLLPITADWRFVVLEGFLML